jgi:hypothetical protein
MAQAIEGLATHKSGPRLSVPLEARAANGNCFMVFHRPSKQHSGNKEDKPANCSHRQQGVKNDEECEGEQSSCDKIQLL